MNKATQQQPNTPQQQGNPVSLDMNLGMVVQKYPQAAEVLLDYGLHCVGCFANTFDTIEMGAKVHGMSQEEMEEMLERINELILYGE